ncbi:MAG: class I SAM-dependent methyltransferase [Opitutaceae bacterium]|nr:class I SAM-dependent methyltransferase [Opitutaceae bacterium]
MAFDQELLTRIGFDHLSHHQFTKEKVVLRDGRSADLWVHKESGHGVLDPSFWEASEYYEAEYRNEYAATLGGESSPEDHLTTYGDLNRRQFEVLATHLTDETKYLEIGCSFGGVLAHVEAAGVDKCVGVDPNKEDCAFVSNRLAKSQIINDTFEDVELEDDHFDLIASFEVLEHIANPRQFLEKAARLLSSGGRLCIEVPNHDDALLRNYKNRGYRNFYYHKAHIHYFTPTSLSELCKSCGLTGQVSGLQMYPFFNQVHWLLNEGPQESGDLALHWLDPAKGTSDIDLKINQFYEDVSQAYVRLVETNLASDCLIFMGRKS